MAELVFLRRGEELMRVALEQSRVVLGRSGGADVCVPHREVSRRHLQLERHPEGWALEDLSGRGTRVDDAVVERALLRGGETITLGDFRIRLQLDEAAGAEQTWAGGEFTHPLPAAETSKRAYVIRVRSADGERVVPLLGDMSVGKDPGNDIVLDDRFASSFHCRIARIEGRVQLSDLGSTNGTWVDGFRMGQGELVAGACLRVGETELFIEELDRSDEVRAYHGIVSTASCMKEVFDLVDRVAPSVAAVTIHGETGTGKELVARAIHDRSERARGPFIPVNCAAISRELVESELFGHEKGAFTGALSTRKGAFEEASGGTIFLDEIGELSADLQAKLLRTLELGEIRRVGSSKPFRVDARVVCATHRDLPTMVKRGTFREDLYYRLCVIRIDLPPLRRRKGDVKLLAEHFARASAPRGAVPSLSADALARLEAHPWPGNVRELKNVLARAMLLRRGPAITAADLGFEGAASRPPVRVSESDVDAVQLPGKTLAEIEREVTFKALKRHGGNRRAAARELGMARSTIQKRAAELGYPPPNAGGADEDGED